MNRKELRILESLDGIIRQSSIKAIIDSIVPRVEWKLAQDLTALLAWEPVPLGTYRGGLPAMIRSSWVFVLRAQSDTGPERHPVSCQRMMSYENSGDLQVWDNGVWRHNLLISDFSAPIESRWVSIRPNMWHRAVTSRENWVVISFHTVTEDALIEERPDEINEGSIIQRRYLEEPTVGGKSYLKGCLGNPR